MTAPLAFVDCETDGVHQGRRAWEVAVVRREPDGTTETLHAFISDVDLTNANLQSLKFGRFYERHPRHSNRRKAGSPMAELPPGTQYRSEAWVAADIEWFTRGAHLVGAVPNFDAEVFADMLSRYQMIPAWHYHLIDIEALAVGYLRGTGRIGEVPLPWSSDELSRLCGVEPPNAQERHTALGDARWAMRLYDFIVTGATDKDAVPAKVTAVSP